MHNQVVADIAIEDQKIDYYSSVIIRQRFNNHHEFLIRIKYDILGSVGIHNLSDSQKLIGKSTVIKLLQSNDLQVAYEFRGIICEISMEQSDNFTSELVLKGCSPTILIETGEHFHSFYKKSLKDISQHVCQPVAESNFKVTINPQHSAVLPYKCQYRESGFHFLNRLSCDYGEWFYYNGQELLFGKPSSSPEVDITYGEDVHNMQMTLRLMPMTFSNYAYMSKEDKLISFDAPASVDGLDEYAHFALQESNKIYSSPVNSPLRQRVDNKADLESFVKKQKASLAADLEILSGNSDNPFIHIGAIANVKVSRLDNNSLVKEDCGKYLITSIDHYITDNGKYYNNFEAIPSGLEIVPVKNTIMPIAESQIATVTDNKDPDGMGRVRVQMLWQQPINENSDWLRVMTPDAGGGKGGAKNRGLVVVPEPGDQVLVCFRYNDPERAFVMGSMFHGKTGGGGGEGNKAKSLTALSGATVNMAGDAINIVDAAGNSIILSGGGKIDVKCSASISLTCGGSSITMDSGGKISITGTEITISGSSKAVMKSTASFTAEANKATTHGDTVEVNGDSKALVNGGGSTEVKSDTKVDIASPATTITGKSNLKLGSDGSVDINGAATTNVKGGTVNLN